MFVVCYSQGTIKNHLKALTPFIATSAAFMSMMHKQNGLFVVRMLFVETLLCQNELRNHVTIVHGSVL